MTSSRSACGVHFGNTTLGRPGNSLKSVFATDSEDMVSNTRVPKTEMLQPTAKRGSETEAQRQIHKSTGGGTAAQRAAAEPYACHRATKNANCRILGMTDDETVYFAPVVPL